MLSKVRKLSDEYIPCVFGLFSTWFWRSPMVGLTNCRFVLWRLGFRLSRRCFVVASKRRRYQKKPLRSGLARAFSDWLYSMGTNIYRLSSRYYLFSGFKYSILHMYGQRICFPLLFTDVAGPKVLYAHVLRLDTAALFQKRNEFVVKDKKQKLLVYFHEQPCKPLQGNRFLFPVDVYEEAQDLDCYVKEGRSSLSE